MRVIAFSPRFWYLLRDKEDLILTVRCEYSFVGYDFTLRLNSDERENYSQAGDTFIDQLAEAINYSCPIARGSVSVYKGRNIDAQYRIEILRAIERRGVQAP